MKCTQCGKDISYMNKDDTYECIIKVPVCSMKCANKYVDVDILKCLEKASRDMKEAIRESKENINKRR